MRASHRWLVAAAWLLGPAIASAASTATSVSLAADADCTSRASVNWSFTYTQVPTREFGRVTIADGTVIGSFDQPPLSPLSGGTYNGVWRSDISIPQPPNTIIGSYGGTGDNPATPANTVEYFVLYSCTTRQVIYHCVGNQGQCPTTAAQAIAQLSRGIPVDSGLMLTATALVLAGVGALTLKRRATIDARR